MQQATHNSPQPKELLPRRISLLAAAYLASLSAWGGGLPDVTPDRVDPPAQALSPIAQLGKKIFVDTSLSASGKMACATCHDPNRAYAPANALPVQYGGPSLDRPGMRAVPSLKYLDNVPPFSIGPDPDHPRSGPPLTGSSAYLGPKPPLKAALPAKQIVPMGGMDWDGRAEQLIDQPQGPFLDPNEMANRDASDLARRLAAMDSAQEFKALFGATVFDQPPLALRQASYALARYIKEDKSFHPYTSRYDYALIGLAQLSDAQERGRKLFDDPAKGNCAVCHDSKPLVIHTPQGDQQSPPVFTDFGYRSLGVPRHPGLAHNRLPDFFDLGVCGPGRHQGAGLARFCGFFKTPTLRNVATRQVFFHNGVVTSLRDAVRFYVERETAPEKWYPRDKTGSIIKYDDIPIEYRSNVDREDPPFDQSQGHPPSLSEAEIDDIVAFLEALTDGYVLGP